MLGCGMSTTIQYLIPHDCHVAMKDDYMSPWSNLSPEQIPVNNVPALPHGGDFITPLHWDLESRPTHQ